MYADGEAASIVIVSSEKRCECPHAGQVIRELLAAEQFVANLSLLKEGSGRAQTSPATPRALKLGVQWDACLQVNGVLLAPIPTSFYSIGPLQHRGPPSGCVAYPPSGRPRAT